MIYPGGARPRGGAGPRGGRSKRKAHPVVQWKQRNVQQGLVLVDETQLSKLIKREPVQRYYELDPEPFATGQFANLRRCRSRDTGQLFAAKFSSRARYGEDCSAEIHHEIALLSLCSPSPRVVRLHDVFETPAEIIIVLEFAPGGDLQSVIDENQVPFEANVVKFVRQLVEGLAYLHDRKIAHLDIKPQNLVMMADFPECDIKICDFEISRVILEGTEIREILGTPDYVAPEILHYEPITLAADMWSLGVTTYVLLTGFSPFGGETDQETFCNISKAQLDFPEELFEDVSRSAQDFIRRLLVRDPKSRPTAKECLRHPWFANQVSATLPRCDSSQAINKGPHSAVAQKNLRKYLSKSREALFERVVQQQQQKNRNSLRKNTLLSQLNKTRLCESQFSLVSKSRERLFMGDHQLMMSPSFSRSQEKLYGLRSLSKSHEVLDFCRTAIGGASQQPQDAAGIIKTLTRATTTDLSMLPVIRQRQLQSYVRSSTTSIPSTVASEVIASETQTADISDSDKSENATTKLPAEEEVKDQNQLPEEISQNESNGSSVMEIPITAALLSPQLLKETLKNQTQSMPEQQILQKTTSSAEENLVLHSKTVLNGFADDTKVLLGIVSKCDSDIMPTQNINRLCTKAEETMNQLNSVVQEDAQSEKEEQFHSLETVNSEDYTVTSESGSEMENNVNDPTNKSATDTDKESEDSEEPRFTVAQLVSAFNKHQEVITKSSLEVTMTSADKETKIPPLVGTTNSKFPTGPNALRLFIPGIDITAPAKKKEKRKRTISSKCKSLQSDENALPHCDTQWPCENEPEAEKTNDDDFASLGHKTSTDTQPSYQEITVNENCDRTNNNCKNIDEDSICHLVIEPPPHENSQERKDTADDCRVAVSGMQESEGLSCYSRSESMSSDTSESRTPSDCYSSMDTCWDEPTTTNHNLETSTETQVQRSTESNGSFATGRTTPTRISSKAYPWGKLCTGSYTRAMEKFGGKVQEPVTETKARPLRKSFIHVPTPREDTSERVRRKSSPVIKQYF